MTIPSAILFAGLGVVFGSVISLTGAWAWRHKRSPELPSDGSAALDRVIAALPEAALLIEPRTGEVVRASRAALEMGLVLGTRSVVRELEDVARQSELDDHYWERELVLHRSPASLGTQTLLVRTVRVGPDCALVLARDPRGSRSLDQVRRDFVANVSHELKTPVGAMALLAEAISMASDDAESVRSFAGRIQKESTRLGQLVSDLIDLSRIETDDPLTGASQVDIDDVVREALEETALPAMAKEIDVLRGGTQGLAVLGSDQQLITAVRNLVANAISYSPPRTRVGVATRSTDDHVEVSVTDQGIGIPETDRDRIFERFYRVDRARSRETGGTGLGLAIVKHVCEKHGGSVSVWSLEGEGSTFTLRLPLARRAMTSGSDAAADATGASHQHGSEQRR